MSPTSLRQFKNILNQSLNEAVKGGLIALNPRQYVELPRKERYESHYYTAEQLRKLFDAMRNDTMLPLVKITALYGLRRSELLGLKWDSVDFTNGLVFIWHTVSKVTKAAEKDKAKSQSSRRSCASLLINNGCGLKDVREWLGHSEIQMTANIYGHLDTARKQGLTEKLTSRVRKALENEWIFSHGQKRESPENASVSGLSPWSECNYRISENTDISTVCW